MGQKREDLEDTIFCVIKGWHLLPSGLSNGLGACAVFMTLYCYTVGAKSTVYPVFLSMYFLGKISQDMGIGHVREL
jgi:hypothetical protein